MNFAVVSILLRLRWEIICEAHYSLIIPTAGIDAYS